MSSQQDKDLKRLQNFIDEEIDCIGYKGVPGAESETAQMEAWLMRCRRYINQARSFKGFEISRQELTSYGHECRIRYADKSNHLTCPVVSLKLVAIPMNAPNHQAYSEALHRRIVNEYHDEEGWITIASVGKLIKAGIAPEVFNLTQEDIEDYEAQGFDVDKYEVVLVATDMMAEVDPDKTYYLWVRE